VWLYIYIENYRHNFSPVSCACVCVCVCVLHGSVCTCTFMYIQIKLQPTILSKFPEVCHIVHKTKETREVKDL